MIKVYKSHGDGLFSPDQLASIGEYFVFEPGVLVFHPENIEMGNNIYVGHNTILKGYYRNKMKIGDNTWIGQNCFFHSAGGITIGKNVGIGPGVKIITSKHDISNADKPILFSDLQFAPVEVGDDSDIGVGAIILPGVKIGKGVQVGAGSVVASDIPDFSIAVGVPSRIAGFRK